MNWIDLVFICIMVVFGIIGLTNGFIFSVFRLASFFISALVSIKLYPVVAKILIETPLYDNIKGGIFKRLMLQQQTQAPAVDGEIKKAAADTVIGGLHLPDFLKDSLISNMPDPTKLIDMSAIMDTISGKLAGVVIDIISLIALYIAIRVGLLFLRFILQGIAKLPLFKQVDKLGGFAFGAVEGLLTIYIICTVIMLFSTSPSFNGVFDAIDNSVVARFFYENNIIVDIMFPQDTLV
ncbi:colicin V production protein [Anaerobacterium chartisolvens]|uniref:Colicin V production protein n=1 Tax=Anaerobacterium chartisolvens TaxID=1297424 RepID=A0A369BHA1_9FIRM|nr:CvpA family protein [Anaerobacterium chartisolvens]RCX20930.1 colicin V production protein [Anaerobacterium chartisolvens]